MSSQDNFGDRMKMYERLETEQRFMPLLPLYVRIDGRSFSKYTRDAKRPFDEELHYAMVATTQALVKEFNAKIGYTQSDEISLILYSDDVKSPLPFDGKKQKLLSVLASFTAAQFGRDMAGVERFAGKAAPCFDCRIMPMPNKVEAANAVLWRVQDATKNAISMAAREYFSHSQLHKKNGKEMQAMLLEQCGVNFNDYPPAFRRGTFVRRETYLHTDNTTLRSRIAEMNMPPFGSVINRTEVIFDGAAPQLESGEWWDNS